VSAAALLQLAVAVNCKADCWADAILTHRDIDLNFAGFSYETGDPNAEPSCGQTPASSYKYNPGYHWHACSDRSSLSVSPLHFILPGNVNLGVLPIPTNIMSSPQQQSYSITEPHPSIPKSNYIHSGRGGAGNYAHVNPQDVTLGQTASGPASVRPLRSACPDDYFTTGRGGAGNVQRMKERAIFSFDEELERQKRMTEHQAPIYHVGRGGAGNLVDEMRSRMGSRSSTSSPSSAGSDSAWGRFRFSVSK
jgi:hypothetical protein